METVMILGMHMANELLDPATALATLALGALAVAIASARLKKAMDSDRLPLMGVLGAFVFAAQMINFTLPGMPGTSGHLGGGVLLAILVGPWAGIVIMAAVLIIQCLLFQDGGLLALGCNIINMGVIPCLLGGWLYRIILGAGTSAPASRQYLAAWVGCMVGLTAGAAMVPVEAGAAGRLAVPTGDFLAVVVGVHLLIGLVEGLITFAVIAYIRRLRPTVLGLPRAQGPEASRQPLGAGAFALSLVGTALLMGGVVSWFASTHPDGLEWSYQEHKYSSAGDSPVKPMEPAVAAVETWQARWAPMADYGKRPAPLGQAPSQDAKPAELHEAAWGHPDGWKSAAGLLGTLVTLAVLYATAALLRRKPKTVE